METIVWHTILEIRDRKFLLHYKISFEAFNNLILELTPFLQSNSLNPIKTQLEIKMIMALLIYQFAHGFNVTHMANRFNLGASTI